MYHVGGNHTLAMNTPFSIAAPCTLCQVARSVLNQCHGIRRLRPHTVNCPSHIRVRRVKKHCQVQTTIYIKFTSVGRNTRCTPKRVLCCAGGQASGKAQAASRQQSTSVAHSESFAVPRSLQIAIRVSCKIVGRQD